MHAGLLYGGQGAPERGDERRRHAHRIDDVDFHVLHGPGHGARLHLHGHALAGFGLDLLRIVQPLDAGGVGQDDRPHGERPRQRPASHLVQADDHVAAALLGQRPLVGVEPFEPRTLRLLGLDAPPRRLNRGPDALARVRHQRPLEHGELARTRLLAACA